MSFLSMRRAIRSGLRGRQQAHGRRRLGVLERLEPRMLLAADPILLGPQTNFFDQPYVEIEMFSGDFGLGPYGSELGLGVYMLDRFLLDTGANSILAAKGPTLDITSHGYQTEGDYHEQGVAGYTAFDVSAPYRFDFFGTDGVRQTLPQTEDSVRILSSRYVELGGPIYAGGIAGLVGMPAMVDRVTSLDLTQMAAPTDIFGEATGVMGVTFAQGENALPPGNGLRYSVPVDTRVAFDPADGLPPGSPPDAPLPVWGDVPFLTAMPEYQGNRQSGSFLLDTGAQMSMLSTDLAMAIGLDEDGDGNFTNERLGTIDVGGVGGSVEVPILLIDRLSLATEQGVDLTWTGTDPNEFGIEVIVLDIAEGIQGILGADLLTAGASLDIDLSTFEFIFGGAPYFDQVHFDFRDMATEGTGMLHFDLHPYRAEIMEGDLPTRVYEGGLGDTYEVVLRTAPTANVTIALDTPVLTPLDEFTEPGEVQLTAVDNANPANTFLTFTPLNWNEPQTVRVAAIDDTLSEGPHTGWVTHRAISADANYDGIRIGGVIAEVVDDDVAAVAGRHVFYNNSIWDDLDSAANLDDDPAIAADKQALLPNQTATIANYTSYDKGINGIMIDVVRFADVGGLNVQTDFQFKVGNNDDPSTWATAPTPRSLGVREGQGVDGSDRVTLLWDDHAVESQWLQVTVLATDATGLLEPDVFYFGNAIAEAGDQATNAIVNATDEIVARNFPHSLLDLAGIEDRYDYNRDRLVNGTDQILARE
ncbi:MAG TPA: retropepsin-like aspartic protease, partial [Thermoguttaceae bacterium]|nr:retropepsin-like aspartic protease [Thermoguttaceae bacterium]